MQSDSPIIWFKSNPDPQQSFAASLWIVAHSQIYNYTHINNYIVRINKINTELSYKDYFGYLMEDKTLDNISSFLNKNLRKLKIKEFYFSLFEDNDPQKAINYMEKGRPLIMGVPYQFVQPLVKYKVVNSIMPGNILYYVTAVIKESDILFIPGVEGVELKSGIEDIYNRFASVIGRMPIDEFLSYYEKSRENFRMVYVNVLTRTGDEVRSLNEY
jgi:hypothetical protein